MTDQMQAFGELSFVKRFILLTYGKESLQVSELKKFKNMSAMEVDNRLFNEDDRTTLHTTKRNWSKLNQRHLVFNCDVDRNGHCKFLGPVLESGSTHFREHSVQRMSSA